MPDISIISNCNLRKASPKDIDILYQWANDPETRRNSFNQQPISQEEHKAWFAGIMNDPDRTQYILMVGDTPVGQIRLDIKDNIAEISYSIAPDERGKGYGCRVIDLVKQRVNEDYPSVRKLKASVKPQNIGSISCFEKSGFTEKYRIYEIDMVNIIRGG